LNSFQNDAVIVSSVLRNRKWAIADDVDLSNPLNLKLTEKMINKLDRLPGKVSNAARKVVQGFLSKHVGKEEQGMVTDEETEKVMAEERKKIRKEKKGKRKKEKKKQKDKDRKEMNKKKEKEGQTEKELKQGDRESRQTNGNADPKSSFTTKTDTFAKAGNVSKSFEYGNHASADLHKFNIGKTNSGKLSATAAAQATGFHIYTSSFLPVF